MHYFNYANDFLIRQYAKAVDWAKVHVESRTLDAWEYNTFPRIIRGIAKASLALAISYPVLNLRSNLSTFQLALSILGAATLAPKLGAIIGSKAINGFRKCFKPAYVAREIQKIVEQSKTKGHSKSVLIFKTLSDPSAAFATHLFVDSFKKWGATHSIDVINGPSLFPIGRAMRKHGCEKQYDAIVLSGHATPQAIILSESVVISKDSPGFDGFLTSIKKHLSEQGSIIINGCHAGLGKDNIARDISQGIPNAIVYASSDKVEESTVEYNDHMTPRFYSYSTNWGFNTSRIDTTKIYRNGELSEWKQTSVDMPTEAKMSIRTDLLEEL